MPLPEDKVRRVVPELHFISPFPIIAGMSQERYAGNILTLKDLGQSMLDESVLVRADLDFAPGEEKTSRRFLGVKPTVQRLLQEGAGEVILLAHNGKGKSLENLKDPLERLLGVEVQFTSGSEEKRPGPVTLFENTRLLDGETKNDPEAVVILSGMGSNYVNNAYATAHRAHASTYGLPLFLGKEHIAAGLQVEKEVASIDEALSRPGEGLVAVIGGAKIATKLPVIENLSRLAGKVLVGGLLPAEIEKEGIVLPANVIVAQLDALRGGRDISPDSAKQFAAILRKAQTVIWNGAMGVFEEEKTAQGTIAIVEAMAYARKNGQGVYLLAGGGETEKFLTDFHYSEIFDFISTGGGAMLVHVSGQKLPSLEVLRK